MTYSFLHSFQSEWLKRKRSLASWMVVLGSFFTPSIIILARVIYHDKLATLYATPGFWKMLWHSSWESMAIFLLPLGVILATSLITQLEYKNNTWKQLHTLPLAYPTVFFSKLLVIITMMLQFFILFNIGIYLSALIPYLVISGVPYPKNPIPYWDFLKEDALFFIDCLPILALQYLMSLQFKNFLAGVGIGFLLWIGSISALSWKYGYVVPYSYTMYFYLQGNSQAKIGHTTANIHLWALGYFVVFTIVGYLLYLNKKEKG